MGARSAECSHVIKRLLNPTTNGRVAIRNARGAVQRACNAERPFFIVVVVTQAEADFRFGLSPEGAQARGEADRPLAQAEGEGEGGRVASVSGETKTFATPSSSI